MRAWGARYRRPFTLLIVTLPDPFRGYAAPSWDTRTLASLIAALGGVGVSAPPALAVADNRYAPNAKAHFMSVTNGTGAGTIQTLSNAVFTTMDIAGTVTVDTDGALNTTTDIYTVPTTGTYLCQALVRVADGFTVNSNLGIGIHTSNVDGAWVQWNKIMPLNTGGGRLSCDYTRIAPFNSGDQLRLYCFQDSGGNMNITAMSVQIWRIG
jgi:hypothetical protein